MIPIEPYSELLQTLYAATLDESQWPVFLGQLCQVTDSKVGLFLRNDSTLGNRTIASGGIPVPEKVERQYKMEHSYTDPYRQAFMRNPRIGIIEGEDLVPHEKLVESGDYASLVLGKSLAHMTCLVLSISPRTQEIITLWRGPGRLRLEPEHQKLLDLLLPHLQNAAKIRRVLGVAQSRARNAESVLNASTTVSILLNAEGKILYMNRAAQQLALEEDGLAVREDRIVLTDRSLRKQFDRLVTQAAECHLRETGGAMLVKRASSGGPLRFLITPLRLTAARESTVRVLVLASAGEESFRFPDAILRQLYALTPAETEIANGLMTGYDLEELAQLRRVSVATIRSQMKSLLAKTDTHRQAELVRLLSTIPRAMPPANEVHTVPYLRNANLSRTAVP